MEVTDVLVQTAQISVKTIRLGKKQMTQSVFRQLPKANFWEWEGPGLCKIKKGAELWGRVNYHTSSCEYHGRHVHVIWTDGKELFSSVCRCDRDHSTLRDWNRGNSDLKKLKGNMEQLQRQKDSPSTWEGHKEWLSKESEENRKQISECEESIEEAQDCIAFDSSRLHLFEESVSPLPQLFIAV